MIREIWFFMTLGSKSRSKLRACATVLDKASGATSHVAHISVLIKKKELSKAVKYLREQGLKLCAPYEENTSFWDNLLYVASGYKMKNEIVSIENLRQGI